MDGQLDGRTDGWMNADGCVDVQTNYILSASTERNANETMRMRHTRAAVQVDATLMPTQGRTVRTPVVRQPGGLRRTVRYELGRLDDRTERKRERHTQIDRHGSGRKDVRAQTDM